MSLYPKAVVKLLPQNGRQPMLTPTTVVVHTNASKAKSLFGFFSSAAAGGVESHFQVLADGVVEQYIDTAHTADANLGANKSAISVETEDAGHPETPWTDPQAAAIRELLLWCRAEHGIELRECTSPSGGGIGWHSMWGFKDRYNLTGPVANPWSPSFGKTCPGPVRIAQLVQLITHLQEGTDMLDSPTLSNTAFVQDAYRRILGREADPAGLAFWVGKLDRGEMTRGDLRFELLAVRLSLPPAPSPVAIDPATLKAALLDVLRGMLS